MGFLLLAFGLHFGLTVSTNNFYLNWCCFSPETSDLWFIETHTVLDTFPTFYFSIAVEYFHCLVTEIFFSFLSYSPAAPHVLVSVEKFCFVRCNISYFTWVFIGFICTTLPEAIPEILKIYSVIIY